MNEAPVAEATTEWVPQMTLPSVRMLVEEQYAMEELMAVESRLSASALGAPLGDIHNKPISRNVTHNSMIGGTNRQVQIAHIKLEGLMVARDRWWSRGVSAVVDALQAAYDDPNIKGILFEVNTGGGEVTAGQMVAASVQSRNKPLLTFAHMAASGGIMATMHSDEVMASSQMAQFGSVGVMYTIPTWMYRYYSGYYKDLYSTLSHNKNRGGREFERDGSVQAWIDELDELAQAFQEEVKNARPLRGDVSHTLSGEMFRANEAKDRGLIDSIGTYQQAFNRLATLARTDRI